MRTDCHEEKCPKCPSLNAGVMMLIERLGIEQCTKCGYKRVITIQAKRDRQIKKSWWKF